LFASDDIDSITRSIVKIFINEVDKAIPNRIIRVRKDSPPWLTTEIKKNIRRHHKRAKRSELADDWTRFRRIRNRCNKLVINSQNDYFPKLSSKIASESRGSKQYWNIIKSLMNYDTTDSRSIPPLQVDGDLICDNKDKAKMFNDFFCNQSDLDDTNIPTPNIFLRQQGSLGHIVIAENEVEDILKILDI
jgi:hypothetical protein